MITREFITTAALIRAILLKWEHYEWTKQGFGFLRTKIDDARIHVWDSRVGNPLASTIHTHPWPLRSTIISGELINQRFTLGKSSPDWPMPYYESRLKTGEGGGLVWEPGSVWLGSFKPDFYLPGQSYEQRPEEIHRTIAQNGTVTLLERPQGPPLEETNTFWPAGTMWGSAEPEKPSRWEIELVINHALQRWYVPPLTKGKDNQAQGDITESKMCPECKAVGGPDAVTDCATCRSGFWNP